MKKAILSDAKLVNEDGTATQYFLELLQNLSGNGLTMPVATTAPTNGQKLTFNGTTNKWEPV